jgi:uncharacterized spore protein YtfJ
VTEQREGFQLLKVMRAEEAVDLIGRLVDVAKPSAVFSEPVEVGELKVITASEVSVSMGVGFGYGSGPSEDVEEDNADQMAMGGGGGGGGYSGARAVAVITVGPGGVKIDPVFDLTKVALAFLTMVGALLMMRVRMARVARRIQTKMLKAAKG